MKKILIFVAMIFVLLAFSSCAKDGLSVDYKAIDNYGLQLLFVTEGHSVYRFMDAGHFIYFVLPGEATIKWEVSNGKTTTPKSVTTSR